MSATKWTCQAEKETKMKAALLHLLSELPADLPTKLFANANRVRLAAGKILSRAGAPATAAIGSRTDSSRLQWFRVPAPSASLSSSVEAPLSVSFPSLTGCRVRQR